MVTLKSYLDKIDTHVYFKAKNMKIEEISKD